MVICQLLVVRQCFGETLRCGASLVGGSADLRELAWGSSTFRRAPRGLPFALGVPEGRVATAVSDEGASPVRASCLSLLLTTDY
ncbi:hypothetical protein A6770_16990 [Nostoc minutum NIES-26]|uniref:Uncharacterized protein n=1 Tax=Nostoc minutum NIES-26 TaxID=1844469 RepID=A0A367RE05_9NOSO|nr:hypothetical protein A6770_16990 [Nostoc minutum NIES-26]